MKKTPVNRLIHEFIGSKDNGPDTRIRAHIAKVMESDPSFSEIISSISRFLSTTNISAGKTFGFYYDMRNTSPDVLEVFHEPTNRVMARIRLNPLHPETKGGSNA